MRFQRLIASLTRRPVRDRQRHLDEAFGSWLGQESFPLTETNLAVFVFKGQAREVWLVGDMTDWTPSIALERLAGTDLFFKALTFDPAARLDYKLVVDGRWQRDPLNPRIMGSGSGTNSELRLPGYQPRPEVLCHRNIPKGRLEKVEVPSRLLGRSRRVTVYRPPGLSPKDPCPGLFFQDGSEYLRLGLARRILDFMAAADHFRAIGCFVHHADRNSDYSLNPAYADFFATELLPALERRYPIVPDPAGRIMIGDSLGGLISAFIIYRHPGTFGGLLGHSGAFNLAYQGNFEVRGRRREREPFGHRLLEARLAAKFFLVWGAYEHHDGDPDFTDGNEAFCQALAANPSVTGLEKRLYPQGHSWGLWRDTLRDGLKWLFEIS